MPKTCVSSSVQQLIEEACARNTPAELHYERENSGIVTGRVRLMGVTRNEILADKPVYLGDDGSIPAGVPITVHIMVRGTRYQFDSVIDNDKRRVPLTARQMVPGIALRWPGDIEESQRRSYLRVSMVGYDPISVYLAPPHPHVPDACSIDAQVITGWLLDISVGGALVLVDRQMLRSAKQGEKFFVTFALPDEAGDFNMLASTRHCSAIKNRDSVRIGLSFRPWRGREYKQDQHLISQFIADHQRRMLRRRK